MVTVAQTDSRAFRALSWVLGTVVLALLLAAALALLAWDELTEKR